MLTRRSIHDERISGVLAYAVLTVVALTMQAAPAQAEGFQPQCPKGVFPSFESLAMPRSDSWGTLSAGSLLPPLRGIKPIKSRAAKVDYRSDAVRYTLLPRSASFETLYLHMFDPTGSYRRWAVDYLIPFQISKKKFRFVEIHGEFEKPSFGTSGQVADRTDLSFGLGQRIIGQNNDFLVGVNAFVDGSQVWDQWNWSGGLGFEAALNISGRAYRNLQRRAEVLDLSFNLYKGGGLDLEAGYSFPVGDYLDLRINAAKYRFYDGEYLLGWRGGAELKASGWPLTLKYEYGQERVSSSYHTVGAFVSVPLELENLLEGRWPFSISNRSSRRTQGFKRLAASKVARNFHHPQTVVEARPTLGIWKAPGTVRWESGQDFSPTESYWRSTDKTGKEHEHGLLIDGHSLGDFVYAAVIGATEYCYRWMFGPYKTTSPPEKSELEDLLPKGK